MNLSLYVEDVDSVVEKATSSGATLVRPIENQFYGDRSGVIEDPWGHTWNLATHVEDISEEEMGRRAQEAGAS